VETVAGIIATGLAMVVLPLVAIVASIRKT
jgi:hypothetical protein